MLGVQILRPQPYWVMLHCMKINHVTMFNLPTFVLGEQWMVSLLCQRWQRSFMLLQVNCAEGSFSNTKCQCSWHSLELCGRTIDPEARVVIKERHQANCFFWEFYSYFIKTKPDHIKAARLVNTERASLACLLSRSEASQNSEGRLKKLNQTLTRDCLVY